MLSCPDNFWAYFFLQASEWMGWFRDTRTSHPPRTLKFPLLEFVYLFEKLIIYYFSFVFRMIFCDCILGEEVFHALW